MVLLGQGWFSKGFLEHIDHKQFNITNITRHEFVNTPMLLKTIDAKNKYQSNTKFTKKIDKLILDEIKKIDLDNKCVETTNQSISWNNGFLVCGLGSNEDIGKKWLSIIEKNKNINKSNVYSIIGSGPTGTELAFYLADLGHIVNIFDMLDEKNVYNYLSKEGKETILDRLNDKHIRLFCGKPFNKEEVEYYTEVIFAIGSRPNDLTKGWTITPKLNLLDHKDVFVGGDCIQIKNAQVAYQQGKYVAETLNQNKFKKNDFKFDNNGIALYCGDNKYYVETKFYKGIIPNFLVELYYLFSK